LIQQKMLGNAARRFPRVVAVHVPARSVSVYALALYLCDTHPVELMVGAGKCRFPIRLDAG